MSTSFFSMVAAVGAGQVCALAIHSLSWWLRHKALWLLSIFGLLGAAAVWVLVFWLVTLSGWEGGPFRTTQQQVSSWRFFTIIASLFCVVGIIGLLHAWQLRPRGRAWLHVWFAAVLAVFGEFLLAASLSVLLECSLEGVLQQVRVAQGPFYTAFFLTLLVLMFLRPLVLKVSRSLLPLVRRAVELRLLRFEKRYSTGIMVGRGVQTARW